ncbi:MAG: oligosaccharide flippase family protein [Clostridiales bacterium]|nr:oligosaccharide flippase family protein [Candidatus Crickella merdequi]
MSRYVGKHEKGRATSNRTPRRSAGGRVQSSEPINQSHSSHGSKLIKGATILAVAGIISKVLGAAFRLPLTNLIGAEGMSYYGAAYPVYSLFLVLSTAGFPVAISRMVSERTALGDHRNAYRTYKVSLALMVSIGALSFIICFFGAGAISNMTGNPGAKASLMAIAPALLLAPIVSSFRGYFQGQQNMVPTGSSQVAEQFVRVCVGLSLSFVLAKKVSS